MHTRNVFAQKRIQHQGSASSDRYNCGKWKPAVLFAERIQAITINSNGWHIENSRKNSRTHSIHIETRAAIREKKRLFKTKTFLQMSTMLPLSQHCCNLAEL